MKRYHPQLAFLLLVGSINFGIAGAEDITVAGRVVDENGNPVSGATVSHFWRANGSSTKPDGTPYDFKNEEEIKQFWGNVGEMAPSNEARSATTANDGTFSLTVYHRARAVLAMDAQRQTGGYGEIPRSYSGEEIQIQLRPVVRVTGHMESVVDGKPRAWSHLYAELAPDPTRPVGINRVLSCGSFDGRFEFLIPPGDYQLDAYAISDVKVDNIDLRVHPAPTLSLDGKMKNHNLGVLELSLAPPDINDVRGAAIAEGTWQNITDHFGKPCPQWHATDVRDLPKGATISDFRGKWVLLVFWGFSCPICLEKEIPKILEIYERNLEFKDRFEMVGICIDYGGELTSMEQVDEALAPIVEHLWNGERIPFSMVLDATFKTWERFGIASLGTVALVNPDGILIEGDESTLEEILRSGGANLSGIGTK